MIICPSCQHSEVEGALFCSECGVQLVNLQAPVTQNISTREMEGDFPAPLIGKANSEKLTGATMTLQVLDGGEFLPLADRNELTIGRVSEGQPVMPDIDLTAYKAYENGVSRLHAVLKKGREKIMIMDLGSSNGTYLNGARLVPESEYLLQNGSIIALGKLKLQFFLQG